MKVQTSNSVIKELEAMKSIVEALVDFDQETANRILRWAMEHYCKNLDFDSIKQINNKMNKQSNFSSPKELSSQGFSDIGELFSVAEPRKGPEFALVAAYWHQVVQGVQDFDAQTINSDLKQLGRRLANVTSTLGSLINQRPQLVLQVGKTGLAQQARKKYRLTTEGIKRVRLMLASKNSEPEK